MAKCNNIHFHLILQVTLFLQIIIIISQPNFLEAVTVNSSDSRARCVEAERKALLKFKADLRDLSGLLSSWVGEDCCGWLGVGCSNHTGNVVKLNLSTNPDNLWSKLSGKLSPSLIELNHLNYLNLSGNDFDGMVLPRLGNLSNLHYLDLSYTFLWTSDLNWLSGLTSLEYLNLGYVDLSKVSTSWLKAINLLPSLSELHLRMCNLEYPPSPPLSLSVANLTSLSVIDLSYNQFISQVPPWLFNITTLVELDLSICFITSPISHLPWNNLHNLEVLNLENSRISDDIGRFIDVLSGRSNSSLRELTLGENHFSGQLGESLGRLTNLKSLWLNDNSISGEIPSSIGMLSFLEELDLSSNKMNGSIPVSFGDLSSLISLDLSYNNWNGKLSKVHFKNLRKLKSLKVSSSGDLAFDVAHDWIPPFRLEDIRISGCRIGPAFPLWIQTQTELVNIITSNVQISGTIPDWFWNLCTAQVKNLDLSGNSIQGVLPSYLQFNSSNFASVDLSYNHLRGPIPLWSHVSYLYLKSNSFSGPIPTEIGTIMTWLNHLDLSLNCLNGTIPKSISKMDNLATLDLSQNNLSGQMLDNWNSLISHLDLSKNNLFGEIPMSICSPSMFLTWLDLSDNSFDGRIPSSLQNCTNLWGLNLGGNRLSGTIPRWLGIKFSTLAMLSLRMNKLTGEIPQELCHLQVLHVLDLSHNNLSSTIPACFGNLSGFMVSVKEYFLGLGEMDFFVKGKLRGYAFNLNLLNLIDLSNNNLAGAIPEEITNLIALGFLNLSRNQLSGKIPEKIREFKLLETLDLSHNHLSGLIPSSMTTLTSLNLLDLSFNNLSGPIPSSTQFSTFDNSIYEGNTGLCGPPLKTSCYTSVNEYPNKGKGHEGGSKDEDDDMFWFYVGLGLGFIVGFWGIVGTLAIKRSWRIVFFKYFDGVNDKLFVFIAVNIARLKRMMKRERD